MSWTPPPSFTPQSSVTVTRHLTTNPYDVVTNDIASPLSSPPFSPTTSSPYCSGQQQSNVVDGKMITKISTTTPTTTTTTTTQLNKKPNSLTEAAEKPSRQPSPQQRPKSVIQCPTLSPPLFKAASCKLSQVASSPSYRSTKKSWQQPSSLFVASPGGSMDARSNNQMELPHMTNMDESKDEGEDEDDHQISSAHANVMVETTMMRTRLEWNQKIVSQAFQPYKAMIRSLDPDNFPDEDFDQSNTNTSIQQDGITSMQVHADELGTKNDDDDDFDDDFYQLPPAKDNHPTRDIRDIILKDGTLTEREIAAFFEGMRFYQTKVASLQSQLNQVKTLHRQKRRTASLVFTTHNSQYHHRNECKSDMDSVIIPRRSSMIPRLSCWNESSGLAAPDPRPFEKSLRTMSIARIRSRVDAMPSDTLEQQQCTKRSMEQEGITGKKEDIQKLLKDLEEAEKYQKRLEKQLRQAGVVIAEDIPYDFAKQQVDTIARRMTEIGGSNGDDPILREEYFRLEQEMEKYTTALQLTDEWIEEQEELERQWEAKNASLNEEALRQVRRHMPVNVRNMSEAALSSQPSPLGKHLPKSIAKRFKRTDCLQLLRMDPDDIVRMHPSTLENMRVTGLTLTERRALYCHLKDVGTRWKSMQSDKMTERKWNWFNMMKSNFKENVEAWQRHIDQYGPPGNHPYVSIADNPNSGCPLIGNQCPLKADRLFDYSGDYGFPEGPQYHKPDIKKSELDNTSKATQEALDIAKEKKENDRREMLKRHYHGKILPVSLASGSCQSIDAALDKMESIQEKIIQSRLGDGHGTNNHDGRTKEVTTFDEAVNDMKLVMHSLADRSGMKMTGKRDTSTDTPDTRSLLEMSLCEEFLEGVQSLLESIQERMVEIHVKDGRVKSNMQQVQALLEELKLRNSQGISKLVVSEERPPRSRKIRTREAMTADIKKENEARNESQKILLLSSSLSESTLGGSESKSPTRDMPSRERGNGGGRSVLMDALKARGRGGRGNMNGRGGLLAAIAARGAVA
jgi:hypothetical protein